MSEPYKTPLQDGVDYKAQVVARLVSSQAVVGLLLNNPEIDLDSDEAIDSLDDIIFDFDYIDRTVERSNAFIMVDADMVGPTSASFNAWEIYVQVVCHKDYVKMDSKIFKGVRGNRRDNLMCEIDKLLNGSRVFGIGRLELKSAVTAMVPDSFTSKLLTYTVHEARKERYGGKY